MTTDIGAPPQIRGGAQKAKNRMIWKAPARVAGGFEIILHLLSTYIKFAREKKHTRDEREKETHVRFLQDF